MSEEPPLEPSAYADAIEFLERTSPADDASHWIGAWLLLRKIRSAFSWATGASIVAAFLALLVFTPTRLDHSFSLGLANYVHYEVARGATHFVVAGSSAVAFFLVYYGGAFLRLGSGVAIPEPYHILRIRNAMLPFDAIAREHLRRWSKSPYAS